MTQQDYWKKRDKLADEYSEAVKRNDPNALQNYIDAVNNLDVQYWEEKAEEDKNAHKPK